MRDPGSPQIQYTVENFGPIRHGELALAPLTIFIGPNGSGKTYMATLVYLFARAMADAVHPGWYEEWTVAEVPGESIVIPDMLTRQDQEFWQKWFSEIPSRVKVQIERLLPSYFGQESADPLAYGGGDSFQIGFQRSGPSVSLNGKWHQSQGWQWEWGGFDQIRLELPTPSRLRDKRRPRLTGLDIYPTLRALALLGNTYFLPAARAGLLQGWRALAGIAIRIVRREFGLRPIEATPYSGVVGDFLLTLVEPAFVIETGEAVIRRMAKEREKNPALSFLEGDILHGYVDWVSREDPQLLFYQHGMKIPLTATSSGLAELAPLDLLLRSGRLRGGDLLVIEEPEAHLHPENQRRIATLMVRLARMGVYVLCTTHSDIILHQVSNHLLLGEALQKGYEIPEFDPDLDRLDYNEVGVYLFRMEGDGSVIEPVRLEPGFGIPQDEFVRVAEAIGSQTYTLLDILETEAEGSPR
jgi:predicted ATPase